VEIEKVGQKKEQQGTLQEQGLTRIKESILLPLRDTLVPAVQLHHKKQSTDYAQSNQSFHISVMKMLNLHGLQNRVGRVVNEVTIHARSKTEKRFSRKRSTPRRKAYMRSPSEVGGTVSSLAEKMAWMVACSSDKRFQ